MTTPPSNKVRLLAPTRLKLALKSPPALEEGGREEPRHKTSWALEVDDGDHGGDEVDNVGGPSVGC